MIYKNKKGISNVITMLIIIALVLVAIGAVWYVVQNVLEEGQLETEQATSDIFNTCAGAGGTVTTEDGNCTGGEIRIIGGEYCCIV
ncbi:hypothetical protein KAT80_02005 [Candidatus Pacearchaeota archaeon]|nr:hypothetical protein [Candidatus Pacearchaeota archaeon]